MWKLLNIMLVAALTVFGGAAGAQDWPGKPVRWILSQPAGASPDITARLLADRLSRTWGQQVVVDNRPGGQNVIGAQLAAKAPPDGYSFYFATTAAVVTNIYTFKSLPYDPVKDFVPVAMIGLSPFVVAVNSSVPAKSIAELVAQDKSQPNKLAMANEGPKTFGGMLGQMLNLTAGMKLLQVPYNGVVPAIQDTIGGRTQVVLVSSAALTSFLKRGDLRALAVTSARRIPGIEEVPTLAESYPGFEYVGWFALLAPAGTSPQIVQKVNRDVNAVLNEPEIAQKLRDLGAITEGAGTPASVAEFMAAERARWSKLVREVGIRPE